MTEIPFLPAARQEFLVAHDHYDSVSPWLGAEFTSEVERAVALLPHFQTTEVRITPEHVVSY